MSRNTNTRHPECHIWTNEHDMTWQQSCFISSNKISNWQITAKKTTSCKRESNSSIMKKKTKSHKWRLRYRTPERVHSLCTAIRGGSGGGGARGRGYSHQNIVGSSCALHQSLNKQTLTQVRNSSKSVLTPQLEGEIQPFLWSGQDLVGRSSLCHEPIGKSCSEVRCSKKTTEEKQKCHTD